MRQAVDGMRSDVLWEEACEHVEEVNVNRARVTSKRMGTWEKCKVTRGKGEIMGVRVASTYVQGTTPSVSHFVP